MKRRTIIKLVIDIIMTALFVALLYAFQTGLIFHEVVGVAACVLMLTHVILNRTWLSRTASRVYKAKTKTRVQFVLDILLIVGLAGIFVSGLLISVVLIPNLDLPFRGILVKMHSWTAYISAGLIGVHILFHIPYLRSVSGRVLQNLHSREFRQVAVITLALCLTTTVLYTRAVPYIEAFSRSKTAVALEGQSSSTPINGSATQSNEDVSDVIASGQSGATQSAVNEAQAQTNIQPALTKEEYLSGLICDGCGKACSLQNPLCSIGVKKATEALAQYQQA
jgi:hypothetical protein